MESAPRHQSLLATVSEQMIELEKRDWQVWLISAGVGIAIGIGILALLFRPQGLVSAPRPAAG